MSKSRATRNDATQEPLVRVRNLSKTFREGVDEKGTPIEVRALRNVSFDIYPGEFIAVTGPNGSGKSTLVNCLGAFEKADKPESHPIQYSDNGQLYSVWRDPEWYRQNFVGIVFQDFHLLPGLRVDQNVGFPLRLRQCRLYTSSGLKQHEMVVQALKRLRIEQHQNKKVNQISGGERQRVAIARALAKEPRLLLADEPTGNLDQQNKERIVQELRALAKDNLSVLMVTHDRQLAERFADRIIHLIDGKIESVKFLRGVSRPLVIVDQPAPAPEEAGAAPQPAEAPEGAAAAPVPVNPEVAPAEPEATAPEAPPAAEPAAAEARTAPADGSGPQQAAAPAGAAAPVEPESKPARAATPGRFFIPGCSQSVPDLLRYSLRDARQSTVSLASNVFAILLGTFLTALLLALLGGTEQYIRHLFRTIPGIDSVHVWVDYSAGEAPMTTEEVGHLKNWPGARASVLSINQFVPLFQKPTREVVASLFSTQSPDPELARLELVGGSREVNPEGWEVVLPMRVAQEIDNFNPQGLVGTTLTLQLRRYTKTARLENAKPTEVLDYPVRVVGIVQSSPQDRVYGSLNMVRFVRDFSTGRSEFRPEPGGRVALDQISPRTLHESLRVHFDGTAAAEQAFVQMKRGGNRRFEAAWPGEKMLYLRDVETVSTIVLIGIGLLAIVAGAVSVFNTLLASVARKTKEIGIMRALGVARADIFLIFISQSAMIGLMACVVGLVVAGLTTYPINTYVTQRWEQLAEAMKAIGGLFQFSLPVALWLRFWGSAWWRRYCPLCAPPARLPWMHSESSSSPGREAAGPRLTGGQRHERRRQERVHGDK